MMAARQLTKCLYRRLDSCAMTTAQRNLEIQTCHAEGQSLSDLAREYGISQADKDHLGWHQPTTFGRSSFGPTTCTSSPLKWRSG